MSWRWWAPASEPALERAEHALYERGSSDPADHAPRYSALDDRVLAIALAREDAAEARGLDPDTRRTCHPHQTWTSEAHMTSHPPNPFTAAPVPTPRPRITGLRLDPETGLVCGEIELPGGLPPEDPESETETEHEVQA